MAERQFQIVSDEPESEKPAGAIGTSMFILGLKTLSQRALAAIADLFMLVTVGSAFVLWYMTPRPDLYQIISLSIYGAFILLANWIVRKK